MLTHPPPHIGKAALFEILKKRLSCVLFVCLTVLSVTCGSSCPGRVGPVGQTTPALWARAHCTPTGSVRAQDPLPGLFAVDVGTFLDPSEGLHGLAEFLVGRLDLGGADARVQHRRRDRRAGIEMVFQPGL